MEKNRELRIAWDFVENTGKSIFLTGKAGTGKTTFLKTVMEKSRKRSIVVAPTGVAAINAGGVTIHSFFQLPLSPYVPNSKIKNRFDFKKEKRRLIASLDLLIIDEISMVRCDLLDAIDTVLRRFRNHYLPFGGVQLLMIGDLQQLTPVVTPEDKAMLDPYYDTPYFFGSKALAETDYVTIQLEKVYRQQDDAFLTILNHIRNNRATDIDLATLNARCHPSFRPSAEDDYIRLTTHNRFADQYNERELERIQRPLFTYHAEIEGTFPEFSYPTGETLQLKVGTQVMFVKNDPSGDHLYYNGRIGKVVYLDRTTIKVHCPGDYDDIEVQPLTWENATYTLNATTREIETEIKGTFKQYPLRLAWSITIHKSQGLTFDHAIIDASESFAPGQVYVALSRCRTIEGMVLSSPLPRHAIINDVRVDNYISTQERNTQLSVERLPQLKEEYHRLLLLELFDFSPILHQQEYMVRIFVEYFSRSYAQLEQLHKQTLESLRTKVIDIADRWLSMIRQAPIATLHGETFLERAKKSADYFAATLTQLLARPTRLSAEVQTGNKQAASRIESTLPELRQTWQAKVRLLQKISAKGFSITTYLREKQMTLLDSMEADDPQKKRQATSKKKGNESKKSKAPKEKTHDISLRMFKAGMKPEEIARERGLALSTIFTHLTRNMESDNIDIRQLVSEEHLQEIERVIELVGSTDNTSAIKALCPPDINYAEINLVVRNRS